MSEASLLVWQPVQYGRRTPNASTTTYVPDTGKAPRREIRPGLPIALGPANTIMQLPTLSVQRTIRSLPRSAQRVPDIVVVEAEGTCVPLLLDMFGRTNIMSANAASKPTTPATYGSTLLARSFCTSRAFSLSSPNSLRTFWHRGLLSGQECSGELSVPVGQD